MTDKGHVMSRVGERQTATEKDYVQSHAWERQTRGK